MKHSKPFTFYLGNLLILSSLFLLFITYYPLIKIYFQPALSSEQFSIKEGFYLNIPKIKASAPISANIDPFNQEEYLAALQKGIAHAKDTKLPGEKGTIFLFAHSSDLPWKITQYNTAFLRLGELQAGDKISVYKDKKEYPYEVVSKKEVWPSEVNYLNNTEDNQLILMTCTPVGTSLKRLLVFAKPIDKNI